MNSFFEELDRMIEQEARRIAGMKGTMEEKERSMKEESLPLIMEMESGYCAGSAGKGGYSEKI